MAEEKGKGLRQVFEMSDEDCASRILRSGAVLENTNLASAGASASQMDDGHSRQMSGPVLGDQAAMALFGAGLEA